MLILVHLQLIACSAHAADVIWSMKNAPYYISEDNAQSVTAQAIDDARRHFTDPAHTDDNLTLLYPSGTYNFTGKPETNLQAVLIANFQPGTTGKLIVKGEGFATTTLVIHNNQSERNGRSTSQAGFVVRRSSRIELRDFHLTVSHQTVSQGTVRGVGVGYVDLEIHKGFPTPLQLESDRANAPFGRYLRKYSYAFDPADPRIVQENNDQVRWASSQLAPNGTNSRLLLSKRAFVSGFAVGDLVAIKSRHGKDLYRFVDCSHITLDGIKFTRKTRGAFINCPYTTVTNIVIGREVIGGQTACLASPEGGPQFQSSVGGKPTGTRVIGLNVDGCTIVGTGDDCLGLFEQDGNVSGNIFQDSFARGVYDFSPGPGLANLTAQNEFVRCMHLVEEN